MKYSEFYARRFELIFKKDYARSPLYAKIVSHRITPVFVFISAKMGFTPNQVTLFSFISGWAGCLVFSLGRPWSALLGALLIEFFYILDSVDGQLARWTRQFSKSGTFFDMMGNYLVHPIIFISLGLHELRVSGNSLPVFLGAVCALGYTWLLSMHDVRANILLWSLAPTGFKPQGVSEKQMSGSKISFAARIFSAVHKGCTFPTLMNIITFGAIVNLLAGGSCYFWILAVYSVLIPTVSLLKIARIIQSKSIDRDFDDMRLRS